MTPCLTLLTVDRAVASLLRQYTVAELKADLGVGVATLRDLGYSLEEMREGSVTAEELKPFGYTATAMHEGTFLAPELK